MADQMSVQVAHLAEHAQSRREESQALEETKKKQEIQRQEVEREKNARVRKTDMFILPY
jgi:predicted ATP-grasp superfamily ATP-dependent carboligase